MASLRLVNNGHTPPVGRADWLSAGKAVTKEIPFSVRHCWFFHFASYYCILRKMSGRYGKSKRSFGTKLISRCRQLSLARSVIRKREKGDSEADTSADAPVPWLDTVSVLDQFSLRLNRSRCPRRQNLTYV